MSREAGAIHHLQLKARATGPDSALKIWLCEKWVLTSYECRVTMVKLRGAPGSWESHALEIDSGDVGKGSWYAKRPVKFSLSNPNMQAIVDVGDIRLVADATDEELLMNGDFAQGLDRWFFAVANYWPWHIENLFLVVFFDLGAIGLLVLAALIIGRLSIAIRSAIAGNMLAIANVAGLVGFMIAGMFNSLIDTPRFVILFLSMLWICGLQLNRKSGPDAVNDPMNQA